MAGTYGVTQIIKPKPSIATSRSVKTGHWRIFYENGQLMQEFFYENDVRIGEEHCYENGVLARVVPYKDGEVEGLCLEYHPNGKLERAIPCIGSI